MKILSLTVLVIFVNSSLQSVYNNKMLRTVDPRPFVYSTYVLKHCYTDKSDPVILIGNWTDQPRIGSFYSTSRIILSLGVEDNETLEFYTSKIKVYNVDPTFMPWPVNTIIIVEPRLNELKIILYKLRQSVWWNLYGTYVVESRRDCREAYDYLRIFWEFNILTVGFTCRDPDHFYSFNPYNSYGPDVCTRHAVHAQKNGHPIFLFKCRFNDQESTSICEDLNYEKTFTLSRFPIKFIGLNRLIDPTIKSKYKFFGAQGKVIEAIYTHLNADVDITSVTHNFILDKNGTPNNELSSLFDGKYDMKFHFDYQRAGLTNNEINTYVGSGMCYITNKDKISMLEHFISLFSFERFILLFSIIVAMILLLSYTLKTSVISIAIDVIRTIVGVSMIRKPTNYLDRTFFSQILIVCMVINFYLQSQTFTLLAVRPVHKRDLRTISDLERYNYNIHINDSVRQYFSYLSNNTHLFPLVNINYCARLIETDVKAACVADCELLKDRFYESKRIRISIDREVRRNYVFLFRNDFPLKRRVQRIYQKLFDHGIVAYIWRQRVLKYKKNIESPIDLPKRIDLRQLIFIFDFIFIAYAFASFVFAIELFFH